MKAYFDSSALVAVYVTEARSDRARAKLQRHLPVPWTALHDLEVRNALRLLAGRGQIDGEQLERLLEHVDEDLKTGRLGRPSLDLEAVFRRAEGLSEAHASKTLARTLDLLHVAASVELGCTELVSGDERQISVAKDEGIEAFDIREAT